MGEIVTNSEGSWPVSTDSGHGVGARHSWGVRVLSAVALNPPARKYF